MGRSEGARQIEVSAAGDRDTASVAVGLASRDTETSGSGPSPVTRPAAPAHVAIIMDGNGRWAARRGLPRVEGHRRGVEAVRRAVRSAIELGVSYLTIYSFSSENWRRPPAEIADLMGLLKLFVRRDLAELHGNNVRVKIIGAREGLSTDIAALLDEAESRTRGNTGLTLVIAFNYGGRQEILRAVRTLAQAVADGRDEPGRDRPRGHRPSPRHHRHPRSRPRHPDLGRAAFVELPHMADGLRRIRDRAGILAGFRSRLLPCGHR